MGRFFIKSTLAALLFGLSTFSLAANITKIALDNKGKSIAVVSISANNYGGSLQGWNSANASDLMSNQLNKMLELTETVFAKDWKVINAKTFAGKPEFLALAGEQRDVGLPAYEGRVMPLFSKDRKQLVKAQVDKDVAVKLASISGADFILVIYSEWAVATGKFVPTSKALTKNVLSIYDASGKQIYTGRQDTQGNRTLGGMGSVVVDANSINEWVVAYEKGLNGLYGLKK